MPGGMLIMVSVIGHQREYLGRLVANNQAVCKDYGQVIDYLEGQISDGVRVVLPIDD